jgi:hypothetical protein
MVMTDSTPKVFFWADLQGKQGGVMQRDEITQINHQLQCYGHASDYRQGCNTYTGWNARSQLGLHRAIGYMKGGVSTFQRIGCVESEWG